MHVFGPMGAEPRPAGFARDRERRRLVEAVRCCWWSPGAEFCGEPAELRQGPLRLGHLLRTWARGGGVVGAAVVAAHGRCVVYTGLDWVEPAWDKVEIAFADRAAPIKSWHAFCWRICNGLHRNPAGPERPSEDLAAPESRQARCPPGPSSSWWPDASGRWLLGGGGRRHLPMLQGLLLTMRRMFSICFWVSIRRISERF